MKKTKFIYQSTAINYVEQDVKKNSITYSSNAHFVILINLIHIKFLYAFSIRSIKNAENSKYAVKAFSCYYDIF